MQTCYTIEEPLLVLKPERVPWVEYEIPDIIIPHIEDVASLHF